MEKRIIVTIGRQYGSGGRKIGQELAKRLGIPFYDKELLNIAAEKSGFCKEVFEEHDEKPTGSFLYSMVMGAYSRDNLPMNHKLFLAQFDAIKEIATEGSCVIIGRCADYALEGYENCVHVFIHGDKEDKERRAIEEYGDDPEKIEDTLRKMDKKRANYYNFYTGRKWGAVENYHITLNSSVIGIENAVTLLERFVEMQGE